MPFLIFKNKNGKYQIKKPTENNKIINKVFLSRESAINMAKRWLIYRKENNIKVVGNLVTGTKLSDRRKKEQKKR
jgi:hypothetical protein